MQSPSQKEKSTKTINSNRKRGYRVERKAVKELEREGYIPFRSAGSRGIFDVLGFSKDRVRLIQCKSIKDEKNEGNWLYKKNVLIKEIKSFTGYPKTVNVTKEIWVWRLRKGWEKIIVS